MSERHEPSEIPKPDDVPSTSDDVTMDLEVDRLCDAFEEALLEGRSPRIEDFLEQTGESSRASALRELLWLVLTYSEREKASALQREYLERFPDDARVVAMVFAEFLDLADGERSISPAAPKSASCIPRYSHFELHAQGGLGQVYRATDEQLHRKVAVKFIRPKLADDEEAVRRFQLEAEVTSRLDHPGVVPVHAIGYDDHGRPFYVMRMVEGTDLREPIREYHDLAASGEHAKANLLLHELLQILISVCETVAYAHNRGVLHRDIKPANIMIGRFGQAVLLDWGLVHFVPRDARARESGEDTLYPSNREDGGPRSGDSHSGGKGGTIGYLSPEQTPGSTLPVGPAADIYSLGATLYRILTGKSPFHHDDGEAVWEKIRQGRFTRPRVLRSNCPHVLEAICLKAMAADPDARYGSAMELADDLKRWIADEPVSVRRETVLEHLSRSARRHRRTTAVVLASVILVCLAATVGSLLWVDRNRTESELQETIRTARVRNLEQAARFASVALAHEIDRRWDALLDAQRDPELCEKILATEGESTDSNEWTLLNGWLSRHAYRWTDNSSNNALAESWFVTNAKGRQIARQPYSASVGQYYDDRSYFHLDEYDLEKADRSEPLEATPPIITAPTLSSAYIGTETRQLKVVFSVPVRPSPESNPIAVLGMGADIGQQFSTFGANLREAQWMLVDLSYDTIEKNKPPQRGAVLWHPQLTPGTIPYRVPGDLVERIVASDQVLVLDEFKDPLAIHEKPHLAVAARIRTHCGVDERGFQEIRESKPSRWAIIVWEPEGDDFLTPIVPSSSPSGDLPPPVDYPL